MTLIPLQGGFLGKRTEIVVTRATVTRNDQGRPQLTETTLTMLASVQQPNLRDIQFLEAGLRTSQLIKVITREALQVAQPADLVTKVALAADIIIYKGQRYQIVSTAAWQDMGGGTGTIDHFMSFAARIEVDGGR